MSAEEFMERMNDIEDELEGKADADDVPDIPDGGIEELADGLDHDALEDTARDAARDAATNESAAFLSHLLTEDCDDDVCEQSRETLRDLGIDLPGGDGDGDGSHDDDGEEGNESSSQTNPNDSDGSESTNPETSDTDSSENDSDTDTDDDGGFFGDDAVFGDEEF